MSEPTIEEFRHSHNCPCWSEHAIMTCDRGCLRCTCSNLPAKVCPSCKCAPHGGSCIQAGPLLTYAEHASPESEDEAFEEWFEEFRPVYAEIISTRTTRYATNFAAAEEIKRVAKNAWNARARLDAERGK